MTVYEPARRGQVAESCVGPEAAWQWLAQGSDGSRQNENLALVSAGTFGRCMRELQERAGAFNLSPDEVHLAAEIASLEGGLELKQRLALLVLCVITLAALGQGSSRFPIGTAEGRRTLRQMARELCGQNFSAAGASDIAAEIESLLGSDTKLSVLGRYPQAHAPLLYLDPHIYHQRVYDAEASLARRLAALLSEPALPLDQRRLKAALEDVRNRPSVRQGRALRLSDEQAAAVVAAAGLRLTVISGGPGTGKTSIVAAILRLLARLGVSPENIALGAPTGKAAYRMGEALEQMLSAVQEPGEHDAALRSHRPEPQTLHRLLAHSPSRGRFRHHRNNPLAASVVIVDEASMVDLALMRGLADALGADARLILLGDDDQLPSVAAGAVLRDLIRISGEFGRPGQSAKALKKAPAFFGASIKLERNYRVDDADLAGRAVLAFAQAINAGMPQCDAASAPGTTPQLVRRASPDELSYRGVELLSAGAGGLDAFLERWYTDQAQGDTQLRSLAQGIYRAGDSNALDRAESERLKPLFNHVHSARILCATRIFATGSERANALLHARAAQQTPARARRHAFCQGEPIIALHNDYARGLFNGDQGLVLSVQRAGGETPFDAAVFPHRDIFRAFPLETLHGSVELCYAMTVHKAQGSEFDRLALIMPDEDLPLLTRELLYTAFTRSRSSVVLIGQEGLIRAAAGRKVERYSGLAERLIAILDARR